MVYPNNWFSNGKLHDTILLLSVADEIIPIGVSLSQAKCVWLNAAVAICQRYRLSEDIALLMYARMILKRSDQFRWA